jgi:biopolymer transport protein ExbB/TolQ
MFQSAKTFLEVGGPAAWVILFLAVVLIGLVAERFYFLYVVLSSDPTESRERVRGFVLSKDYAKALHLCSARNTDSVLTVLKAGLMSIDHGREAIKSALGTAIIEVTQKCEKRLSMISLIANVATLLGLLGTIFGLIKTFAALSIADTSQKAEVLGRGISEAMYATAFGLVVAIVALAAYSILCSRSDEVLATSQDAGHRFINWIEQSERG